MPVIPMNISLLCPMCQHSLQYKAVEGIRDDYFSTTCEKCSTIIHYNSQEVMLAYFVNISLRDHQYQLCFYTVDTPMRSHEAQTFAVYYFNKNDDTLVSPGKWERIITLPFLPNITLTNMQSKLQTMLTFL